MPVVLSDMIEVCVFRFERDQVRYLILRRADDEALYPRLWQFTTGIVEKGESALAAAMRELREETRLEPMHVWAVPHTSSFLETAADQLHLVPLIAVQTSPGREPVLSPEHSAYRWLPFHEAVRLVVWPGQKDGLRMVRDFIVNNCETGSCLQVDIR